MANYLVTGGAGFIGSNLAERLIKDGHNVLIIDDLSTGDTRNIPLTTTFIRGKCSEVLPFIIPVDGIFHLGIPSSTPLYRNDRNLVGESISSFIRVLEFAKDFKLRLIYASSSSIYNGNSTPYKEDMPIKATDFYTEARYSMERLASVYHQFYGVQSIGLRQFSVYGQHEEAKGKFANLITQMIWAKECDTWFNIYGDGQQKRDVIFVSDVVEAYILAMNSPIECDVFNIGTGKSYSINEMASMIGTQVNYIPNPLTNYVQDTLADTSKAEDMLGFKAKVSLEEGVELLSCFSSYSSVSEVHL